MASPFDVEFEPVVRRDGETSAALRWIVGFVVGAAIVVLVSRWRSSADSLSLPSKEEGPPTPRAATEPRTTSDDPRRGEGPA
jgi:hypothetical protein